MSNKQLNERPTGYNVLIHVKKQSKYAREGSPIEQPKDTQQLKQKAETIGTILDVGPDAWPPSRCPSGAWAQVGDTVRFVRYAGVEFEEGESEEDREYYRIVSDDDVISIVGE